MNAIATGFAAGYQLVKLPHAAPRLRSMVRPSPSKGEVLIRVATVGMCRTDLLVAKGSIPICRETVLGHEFSGWIEEIGPDTPDDVRIGDLVAGDPTFPKADGRDGFIGVDSNGAMASWIVMPAARVHHADGLAPRQAAYLEPVTAAMGGLALAQAIGGRGAILGDNRIAALTSAVMRLAEPSVPHDLLSIDELAAEADASLDWIIETCMSDEVVALCVRKLKAGGTLILKSRHLEALTVPVRDIVLKRITLAGRTRSGFPEAMDWIKANPEVVAGLLGSSYDLADWEAAFEAASTGEGNKVFIDIASEF